MLLPLLPNFRVTSLKLERLKIWGGLGDWKPDDANFLVLPGAAGA